MRKQSSAFSEPRNELGRQQALIRNNANNRQSFSIDKFYERVKILGEGSLGSVELVKKKGSDRQYALKSIITELVSEEFLQELRNEVEVLRDLDHPNIVKLYETYEDGRNLYLVMQSCTGGDLHSRLPYSEFDAANIIASISSAIAYMHKKNIIHRDLKFENVVFSNDGPDAVVKVIDFGLSKVYTSENRYMFDVCGTLYTMSPQVIRGVYTNCADMWAIGVIAYMLLSNKKPFYHRQREVVMEKIINVDYNFRGKGWQNISDDAKDFVARCLVAQPKGRMTAVQACDSKWLNNMKQLEGKSKMSQEEFAATIKENFEAYAGACQLKKLALTIVAHKSNSNEILMLLNAFKEIDKDHDGEISKQDFIELMSGFDYTREEIDSMFSSLDVYAGGFIQYTEFIASSIEAVGKVEETRLREAFDRLDVDSSGYITRENLRDVLGKDYSDEVAEKYIREVDIDEDGQIGFDEFLKIFRSDKEQNIKAQTRTLGARSSQHILGVAAAKFDMMPELKGTLGEGY